MIGLTTYTETSFDEMLPSLRSHFQSVIEKYGPLFEVVPDGDLYATYLDNLPMERQHHVCHCCRRFIEQFGNLAAVDDDGNLVSAMWTEEAPDFFRASFAQMARAIRRGKIETIALFKEKVWGTPSAGGWTHFSVTPPKEILHKHPVLTAGQVTAAKKEDYRTLCHGLGEFSKSTVHQAATLLEAETLYRGEKVIGPVRFLIALHEMRDTHKGRNRENLTWKAVATAPPGFCQPRSTMIGTLLEDIGNGLSFETVQRRFSSKMNPLQYQRPTAAPSAGNIAQAEKLFAEMGLEPALHRRFARLEDVQSIWTPKAQVAQSIGGIFGHLQAKGTTPDQPMSMPAQQITWTKFVRTVLPSATSMQVFMESSMNFCGLITAVNPDAPPIIQWDTPEFRNPVSWYVYSGKSTPSQWSLKAGTWVDVTGVTYQPSMWGDPERNTHQGKSAILILKGAQDQNTLKTGLGLFPEILKSELHSVRSTIEAYSRSRQLEGKEEASANGLRVGDNKSTGKIRVTTAIGTAIYTIDRWD
jgi:hypothetical protein